MLAIIAVLVSDTMAIYTKSFDFNLTLLLTKDPNRPIVESDFLKYEFNTQKTCDYNAKGNWNMDPNARKCAQGSVTFDPKNYTMTVKNDAGAMKNYPIEYGDENYIVNARVTGINPTNYKNFGLIFNGSFSDITNGKISAGYTLKFKENGDLVINEEGFANNEYASAGHDGDKIHVGESPKRDIPVATHDEVAQALNVSNLDDGIVRADYIDMQVRVSVVNSNISAYVYLNGQLINQNAITIGIDRRIIHAGGSISNNMIGFSTYGEGTSVTVRKLYMEPWDGVTTEYSAYPIEDNEYN